MTRAARPGVPSVPAGPPGSPPDSRRGGRRAELVGTIGRWGGRGPETRVRVDTPISERRRAPCDVRKPRNVLWLIDADHSFPLGHLIGFNHHLGIRVDRSSEGEQL